MPIAKEEDSYGGIFLQNILEKFIFLPYSEITPAIWNLVTQVFDWK